MKILMVEDDLDLVEHVLHRFEPEGIVAEHVCTAADANLALRELSFDVAVVDVPTDPGPTVSASAGTCVVPATESPS